jgi:hypothetical protein
VLCGVCGGEVLVSTHSIVREKVLQAQVQAAANPFAADSSALLAQCACESRLRAFPHSDFRSPKVRPALELLCN